MLLKTTVKHFILKITSLQKTSLAQWKQNIKEMRGDSWLLDNTVRLAGTCVYEDCGGPFGFGFIFSKTAACVVNHLLFFFFVVVLCGFFLGWQGSNWRCHLIVCAFHWRVSQVTNTLLMFCYYKWCFFFLLWSHGSSCYVRPLTSGGEAVWTTNHSSSRRLDMLCFCRW